jgi:predicted nucleic acid-binding Zn ribbon protein
MSFTSFGDGLSSLVRTWAKDPEFRWSLVERAWRTAAGEAVGDRAVAESLAGSTLTVRVSDPRWLPALRELETDLVIAMRRRPGGDLVTGIAWVTGEADSSGRP